MTSEQIAKQISVVSENGRTRVLGGDDHGEPCVHPEAMTHICMLEIAYQLAVMNERLTA